MIKWRLQKCERRFLCTSVWRCRSASHQISCICHHLPAAVSPVSGWNGAALLQQPNTEVSRPVWMSPFSFLFFLFSRCSLPCTFLHSSAALSSSRIPPAVASPYKCLPPFVAVCLVCHRWHLTNRTANGTFPFACPFDWWCSHQWLFLTERLSGEARTHRRVPQSHTVAWTFYSFHFFLFFHVKNGALCDTWLMAYWICRYSPVLFCHIWEN